MTLNPITAATTTPAFEAMMIMAEHGIHHLPVCDTNTAS
ncbi:CBS domain-containing protein [Corynebacterium silvaticum]